jgi:(1->4)-alpha-D-glucan 1-alpha-D-glucosylmutase
LKFWTTHRALHARNESNELFRHGDYKALRTEGDKSEHVVAFARQHNQKSVIVAVPRLYFTMLNGEPRTATAADWGTTSVRAGKELSGREYRNAFTGERLKMTSDGALLCSELFAGFPVALLVE